MCFCVSVSVFVTDGDAGCAVSVGWRARGPRRGISTPSPLRIRNAILTTYPHRERCTLWEKLSRSAAAPVAARPARHDRVRDQRASHPRARPLARPPLAPALTTLKLTHPTRLRCAHCSLHFPRGHAPRSERARSPRGDSTRGGSRSGTRPQRTRREACAGARNRGRSRPGSC